MDETTTKGNEMQKTIEQGSRQVKISANTDEGPFTSRLYVDNGEMATTVVKNAKTLKGAEKQAQDMLAEMNQQTVELIVKDLVDSYRGCEVSEIITLPESDRTHCLILSYNDGTEFQGFSTYHYISDGDGFGRSVYLSCKRYKTLKGARKRAAQVLTREKSPKFTLTPASEIIEDTEVIEDTEETPEVVEDTPAPPPATVSAPANGRVKVQEITIERAEGLIEECKAVTVKDYNEANAVLMSMSATAPANGGYDKCDFWITFENGRTYEGRYDLKHHSVEIPDLAAHVRDFVRYSSGIDCPDHMTEESWREFLNATQQYNPGSMEAFADLYHNFDVGIYDTPEPPPASTDAAVTEENLRRMGKKLLIEEGQLLLKVAEMTATAEEIDRYQEVHGIATEIDAWLYRMSGVGIIPTNGPGL